MKTMMTANLKEDRNLWFEDENGQHFNLDVKRMPAKNWEELPAWTLGSPIANNWIFNTNSYRDVFEKGMREIDSTQVFECDWKTQVQALVFESINEQMPAGFQLYPNGFIHYTGKENYSWEEVKATFDFAVMHAWSDGLLKKGFRLVKAIYRVSSHDRSPWANSFND